MGREFVCKIRVELPESAASGDAVAIKNLTISCLQHGLAGTLLLEPIDETLVADAAALFRGRYSDRLPDVKWSDLVTTVRVGTALAFGVYPSLESADSSEGYTPNARAVPTVIVVTKSLHLTSGNLSEYLPRNKAAASATSASSIGLRSNIPARPC